jgi:hypothetical protein
VRLGGYEVDLDVGVIRKVTPTVRLAHEMGPLIPWGGRLVFTVEDSIFHEIFKKYSFRRSTVLFKMNEDLKGGEILMGTKLSSLPAAATIKHEAVPDHPLWSFSLDTVKVADFIMPVPPQRPRKIAIDLGFDSPLLLPGSDFVFLIRLMNKVIEVSGNPDGLIRMYPDTHIGTQLSVEDQIKITPVISLTVSGDRVMQFPPNFLLAENPDWSPEKSKTEARSIFRIVQSKDPHNTWYIGSVLLLAYNVGFNFEDNSLVLSRNSFAGKWE